MKPPAFLYACPRSLQEALDLAAAHGDEAKLLAGGQSLVAMMNLRLAEPKVLIDLNRIAELCFVERDNGSLQVGAMTRHRQMEVSPAVLEAEPLLSRVAREIGHLAIRNRGTIGGSLAHADPAAEWPLVAVTLDARLTLRSTVGVRSPRARRVFPGPPPTPPSPAPIPPPLP